jgi:hypothetical protein
MYIYRVQVKAINIHQIEISSEAPFMRSALERLARIKFVEEYGHYDDLEIAEIEYVSAPNNKPNVKCPSCGALFFPTPSTLRGPVEPS